MGGLARAGIDGQSLNKLMKIFIRIFAEFKSSYYVVNYLFVRTYLSFMHSRTKYGHSQGCCLLELNVYSNAT